MKFANHEFRVITGMLFFVFSTVVMPLNIEWSINTVVWKEDQTTHVVDKPALIYMVLPLEDPCAEAKEVFRKFNIIEKTKLVELADCSKDYEKYIKKRLEEICQVRQGQNLINFTHLASEHSLFYGSVVHGTIPRNLKELTQTDFLLTPDHSEDLFDAMKNLMHYKLKYLHEQPLFDVDKLTDRFSEFRKSFTQFDQVIEFGNDKLRVPQQLGGKFYDLVQRNSESTLKKRLLFQQEIESDCFTTYAYKKPPLVHILMSVPIVSRNMIVIKADTFNFLVAKDEMACEVRYNGPERFILDKDLWNLYPLDDFVGNVVEIPQLDPIKRKEEDDDSVFKIASCFPLKNDTFLDYVQVKETKHNLNIYCPFSTISIDDTEEKTCPDYPFTIDNSFEISINGEMYSSGFEQDESYSLKVDWYIRPLLNLSKLTAEIPVLQVKQVEKEEKEEKVEKEDKEGSIGKYLIPLSYELYIPIISFCVVETVVIAFMIIRKLKSGNKNNQLQLLRFETFE